VKLPPHNLDAEHAIIGIALLDTHKATATGLQPDDFYAAPNQIIWQTILTAGHRQDPITLADLLTRNGHTDPPYRAETLTNLMLGNQAVSLANHYAHIIKDTADRRRLIHQTATLTDLAYDAPWEQLHTNITNLTANPTTNTGQLATINWPDFWNTDLDPEDWAIYPLIPRGRAVALYAPAKAGKSTILLAAIAAAVTGRPILGTHPSAPITILYLDYEMTEADVRERLTLLGYGPQDDLSRLHYAMIPALAPLDTATGAHQLLQHAQTIQADLVVVDTFGRAVQGEENESDTVRAFYRHTGSALKAAGIAVLRTDHAGKDKTKGQRGSSAKNDDVDLVWELARTDTGVTLTRTHTRITWAPTKLTIDQRDNGDGTLTYRERDGDSYPHGTRELMLLLQDLDVPANAGMRTAQQAIRNAGQTAANDLIRAAQRARRNDIRLLGNLTESDGGDHKKFTARVPDSTLPEDDGTLDGTPRHTALKPLQGTAAHLAARGGTPERCMEGVPPLSISGTPGTPPDQLQQVTEQGGETPTIDPDDHSPF
jgi:hypothetical protein